MSADFNSDNFFFFLFGKGSSLFCMNLLLGGRGEPQQTKNFFKLPGKETNINT